MTTAGGQEIFDCVFIGTSPICVMEAAHQSFHGKSVLMVDQGTHLGGAWCSMDIFGLHDVENAIHYFLDDPRAFCFMKQVLGWNITTSSQKYRVFAKPFLGIRKMHYDHILGRLISDFVMRDSGAAPYVKFYGAVRNVLRNPRKKSFYIKEGAPLIVQTMKDIVSETAVRIRLSLRINDVRIDHVNGLVSLSACPVDGEGSHETLLGRRLFMSHGSKIKTIRGTLGDIDIQENVLPRPAVHLLMNDRLPETIREVIFINHPVIKYVHDVSAYTREYPQIRGKKKVLVLALQHEVSYHDGLYESIVDTLKECSMVGTDACIDDHKWSDIFLPPIDTKDLIRIRDLYRNQVDCLLTENFARGIGMNADRWTPCLTHIRQTLAGKHAEAKKASVVESFETRPAEGTRP